METEKTTQTGDPGGNPPGETAPDLERMAADLAAKHAAAPTDNRAINRGGRKTAAEEAASYCERNGLRMVPAGEGDPEPVGDPQPAYVVTPEFVRSCAGTLLRGIEAFTQRQAYLTSLRVGAGQEQAKELAGEAGAPPGAIDVMSLCMAEISQKYNFLASSTPEVLLGIAALTWSARYLALMRRLNQIAAEQKKQEQAGQRQN